ncbi:MAG: ferritin-like domain-containing protein [Myxococcales bacterium]|nr:ferritin-like domain-containing protein [Myxococcales bacterium]
MGIRIHALILATVAGLLASCGDDEGSSDSQTTSSCGGDEPFELDEMLTADMITGSMSVNGYTSVDELTCEDLCRYAAPVIDVSTIDSCTHTLEVNEDADDTSDEAATGTISCAGAAVTCVDGRRPLGHVEAEVPGHSLAAYLARSAHMEAASIGAFTQLADQLTAREAPLDLIRRCLAAAEDEREHARLITELARAEGALPPPVEPTRPFADTLLNIALNNATEGCAAETWSALMATWMATRAREPRLRAVYEQIARDETRHAQLAWDLHAWLIKQLSPRHRARVVTALDAALAELPAFAHAQARGLPRALGIPTPAVYAAAAEEFRARLRDAIPRAA